MSWSQQYFDTWKNMGQNSEGHKQGAACWFQLKTEKKLSIERLNLCQIQK